MESFNETFVVGIFCLLCISSMVMASGVEDYTRRPVVHEMRDAIHQVGYNYPSWPSPSEQSTFNGSPGQGLQWKPPQHKEEVTTLDRFYRVSPDGTVEFKVALNDGQINYQKIYNKIVNNRTIQVYDGYYSVRLNDGRYRTTYYRADEKGYRLLRLNVDTIAPVEWRDYKKGNSS